MVKKGISLPSGQGGLVTSFNSNLHSKIKFPPKVVILFCLICVFIIWIITFLSKN